MRWIAMAAGLAMLAPAWSGTQQATVTGPKVLLIGGAGTAGSVRGIGFAAAGLEDGPIVDVHTGAPGTHVRDLTVAAGPKGKADFAFTLEYDASTPSSFEVEIVVSAGSGRVGATGMERYRVSVKRV